VDAPDVG